MMKTKIILCAIRYKIKGDRKVRYALGRSHAECMQYFYDNDLVRKRDMNEEIQGFITNNNVFVDRAKARKIALRANQIPESYDKNQLYSEFVEW